MRLNKRYWKRKGIGKGTNNYFWLSILRFKVLFSNSLMKIFFWNVCGLDSISKHRVIREAIVNYGTKIFLLLEPKMNICFDFWLEVCGIS